MALLASLSTLKPSASGSRDLLKVTGERGCLHLLGFLKKCIFRRRSGGDPAGAVGERVDLGGVQFEPHAGCRDD